NHAQAARANLALQGQLGDGFQSVVGEFQAHILKFEELLVLTYKRVLRFLKNANQRRFVEISQNAEDRETADKFGNQAVTNQVGRLRLLENFDVAARRRGRGNIRVEAERFLSNAAFDNFFHADECATADKKNVRGVHGREFLMRMLAAALRGNVRRGAFQNFQQRLLNTFAGNVASDGRVFVLLGNFVDLVDINDALLRLLHVAIGGLQQLQNNIFNIFADVAR